MENLKRLPLLHWDRLGDGIEEALKIAIAAALARLQNEPWNRFGCGLHCLLLDPAP